MEYRPLGSTGIRVSAIALGAGPVAQLLTGNAHAVQRATLAAALESGINWVDTAATYGNGRSEQNLGRLLAELKAADRLHVATKVRLEGEPLNAIGRAVRHSVTNSLRRLGLERITLVQVHNAITEVAGSQPTSITPGQVLSPGGVLEALEALRRDGLVEQMGLTALGDTAALDEVLAGGDFATIQIPYNLLNPSAGRPMPADFPETDHGNLIATCAARGMGVFAIRVLAAGALAARPPSPHTRKTPFFPLDLYERDAERARKLSQRIPPGTTLEEWAVRFALSHSGVSSAIVGLGSPDEVRQAVDHAAKGPLDSAALAALENAIL
jgi:aryl-alcohol dehydrogenase-like predicted oxidoreductase